MNMLKHVPRKSIALKITWFKACKCMSAAKDVKRMNEQTNLACGRWRFIVFNMLSLIIVKQHHSVMLKWQYYVFIIVGLHWQVEKWFLQSGSNHEMLVVVTRHKRWHAMVGWSWTLFLGLCTVFWDDGLLACCDPTQEQRQFSIRKKNLCCNQMLSKYEGNCMCGLSHYLKLTTWH